MTMRWRIPAVCDRSYEIRVSDFLLEPGNDGLLGAGRTSGRRFFILDAGVAEHWQAPLQNYLAARGIDAGFFVVPGGEQAKNMETVGAVLGELRRFGLDRRTEPIIVVGGGAVLDLGGFAASVYRRGVPWLRVPTTLFGYVALSAAVRCGVNAGGAANLIASSYAPKLVLLDRSFLSSLPSREIAGGLGKLLELGLLHDAELFTALESGAETHVTRKLQDDAGRVVLGRAIDLQLRQPYAGTDPSFAAAFAGFADGATVRHGEATALSARLSATISAHRGMLPPDELIRVERLGRRLGLPAIVPDISARVLHDALGRSGVLLPRCVGAGQFVRDVTMAEVALALDAMRQDHSGAGWTVDSATADAEGAGRR
ncbi:iron-containing alcohol dehydrogenase [Micromonospora sp. NIE79]|uniref:Iron-containing alcohol dehydrogenase n=1 Tax=Micromonospora trifolii TaxID=2911208 RepID=A0ABS9NCR7_9ACTN|nr:iron-containing alcohol dehydrogenase [Micromonospora trifolii]MCG5447291.1 iron-containing alcohol dehydrogenase [Micromonospora trifolii]